MITSIIWGTLFLLILVGVTAVFLKRQSKAIAVTNTKYTVKTQLSLDELQTLFNTAISSPGWKVTSTNWPVVAESSWLALDFPGEARISLNQVPGPIRDGWEDKGDGKTVVYIQVDKTASDGSGGYDKVVSPARKVKKFIELVKQRDSAAVISESAFTGKSS